MPVPGPLQSVQRAEFWWAFLALQAFWPCHLGIDNLNVLRSIGRLLDHGSFSSPLPLVKDGDLIAVVQHKILARGPETVRVTQVKRHATEDERHEDKWGNAEADTAADLGGRHQLKAVMDVRRTLLQVRTQVCFFSRYFALAFWDSGSGTLRDFLMGGHDPFGAMGGTPVAH